MLRNVVTNAKDVGVDETNTEFNEREDHDSNPYRDDKRSYNAIQDLRFEPFDHFVPVAGRE